MYKHLGELRLETNSSSIWDKLMYEKYSRRLELCSGSSFSQKSKQKTKKNKLIYKITEPIWIRF